MVNVNPECMIGNHKRDGFLPVFFQNIGLSEIGRYRFCRGVKPEKSAFSMPVGAKMVMTSQSARVEKMFASFDLGSVSISFVGMMGDFAVWAWFLFISSI